MEQAGRMPNTTHEMSEQPQSGIHNEHASTAQHPIVDGYAFVRRLGHGSQADVWLAERKTDKQKVAVKRLNIESVKNWKEYELFKREASVLATLDIDGVAKFYEAVDRLDDKPPCSYIIREYIEGRSLAEMIKSGQRFSVNRIYDIILQLIDILQKLHTHEPPVIHRDLKPSNILITEVDGQNKVTLIDFGAVANPQVQSGGSTVAGTYGYMPPEQLMGKPVPQSDIYALAAVAVHLITGISPANMLNKDFHLIFDPQMQNMPVAVVNTLRSMLEPKVESRLCDYDTLRTLFNNFKNNDYTNTGRRQSPMSIAEYNKKLRQVSTYGEPGNIELWQELPDSLPRYVNDHKHVYFKIQKSKKFQTNGTLIFNVDHELSFIILIISITFWFYIFLREDGLGLYLMNLGLYLMNLIPYSEFSVLITFVLFILCICIFLCVLIAGAVLISLLTYCIYDVIVQSFHKHHHRLIFSTESESLIQKSITDILHYGRKTIATIVSVEYYNIEDKYLEINSNKKSNANEDNIDEAKTVDYFYHGSPLFKLTYKFNPPDDETKEDLVHHIYTHLPPENHFKAGDPLPILYRIYRDEINREFVDSMPYPLPLDDIGELDNAVYHKLR